MHYSTSKNKNILVYDCQLCKRNYYLLNYGELKRHILWKFSPSITERLHKVLNHRNFYRQSLKGYTKFYIPEGFTADHWKHSQSILSCKFSPSVTKRLHKVLDHSNFHLKSLKGFTKFSWKFSLPITGRLQKVLYHGSFLHQSLKGFTQYYITEVFHHQSLKGVTKFHITEFSPPITESTVLFHGSFFRQSGRIHNALYHGSST